MPADGPFQGAAEDDVDLADGRLRERTADVWPATVVALVRADSPVVGVRSAVAVRPAPAQLGVEGVEDRGVKRAHLLLADQREDV